MLQKGISLTDLPVPPKVPSMDFTLNMLDIMLGRKIYFPEMDVDSARCNKVWRNKQRE